MAKFRAIASTPRNGTWTVIIRAVDDDDRCLYDHPRIELPAASYEHAQQIAQAYNKPPKEKLK